MKPLTDTSIVTYIQQGGRYREEAITWLMRAHIGYIHKVHQKLRISEEEARDAFTDALLVFSEHVQRGTFRGESKVSTFLYRIFYNKSVDLLRKKTTKPLEYYDELPPVEDPAQETLRSLMVREDIAQLKGWMAQIGDKCRKILLDWGFWGYNMEEIAQRNQLADAKAAKNHKYKCLQKLLEIAGKPGAE